MFEDDDCCIYLYWVDSNEPKYRPVEKTGSIRLESPVEKLAKKLERLRLNAIR